MGIFGKAFRVSAILAVILVYCTVLWLGLTEESRRSLAVESSSAGNDFVIANVRITSVDTAQGLAHGRIRLVPMGRFAIDKTTPATDLTLLVNSISGKQKTTFPKGERIVPIEFTGLLSGNQSKYPFDRYTTDIELVITAPAKKKPAALPPEDNIDQNADPLATTLIVGANDLEESEPVPIKENFLASIPGFKFEGKVTENSTYKLMQTAIAMRRANNVINISLIVMAIMFGLAISIVRMVLTVTASPGEMNLLPLSLSITLIFGLPALRNIQPGVPPIGGFSDYMSFIWAEMMVSISAIALAWTWIFRSKDGEQDT